MALRVFPKIECVLNTNCRFVSSFISKSRQKEIDQRNIKEKRRAKKVQPGHDANLPVYTFARIGGKPITRYIIHIHSNLVLIIFLQSKLS